MPARLFRCQECGYPFKTAADGWARNADLMCPACGSDDVMIVVDFRFREAAMTTTTPAHSGAEEALEG